MKMIEPVTGWFNIVDIPMFDLEEVELGYDEYTDKSFARVIQMFKHSWICRYMCPQRVVFDNNYDFWRNFTSFLK